MQVDKEENDINTADLSPDVIVKWKKKLIELFDKKNDKIMLNECFSDDLEKKLFKYMKVVNVNADPIIWEVEFEDTWFTYKKWRDGKKTEFLLLKTKNIFPRWNVDVLNNQRKDSNGSAKYVRRNEVAKQIVRKKKKKKIREDQIEVDDQNLAEEEEEEMERNRDKINESQINVKALDTEWLNVEITQNVKNFLPPNISSNFVNKEIPVNLSNEEIFGLSKMWIDHLKEGENWNFTPTLVEIEEKKEKDNLLSPEIIRWFKSLAVVIMEQRKTTMIIMTLFNTLARRLSGLRKIENRDLSVKQKNNQRIAKLEKQTNAIKQQIGAKGKIQIGNFSKMRQIIAKKNIQKYKNDNSWVDDKTWKNLSLYEKIMKRWNFTDVHQCLTPWDENKLSESELNDFHRRKKEWRSKRRDEINKNARNKFWLIRRFNRFCHSRIINGKIWLGLDNSYDEYLGIRPNYNEITWKFVRRRNFWRKWTARKKVPEMSNLEKIPNKDRFEEEKLMEQLENERQQREVIQYWGQDNQWSKDN